MKFSKLRFAAVGILLGTSGLVVSCGGGDAVTPVSEPQPPSQRGPIIDGSEPCIPPMNEVLGLDNRAEHPQPPLSKPHKTDGIDDPTHHKDAGCTFLDGLPTE